MSNVDEEKKIIRSQIRKLKELLPEEKRIAKSKRILTQVEQLSYFREASAVMLYWSMDDEVYTHDFIRYWGDKKQIILPCVSGDELLLRRFENIETMRKGETFSIFEPSGELFQHPENIDLIIVPGVAFDQSNNRIGRGKAYYDKLLKSSQSFKLGICFDFQLLKHVPIDQYDVKMDLIISG
ncbi:MAG: 5-formyltetrahydrofolate cyclo-ligase [Bacteroidales bacterium]|jgi:5-formyltetrahydrofolate cyclo-ligase|nr:5-formyltetrahydrofolate cyclo-ligase [Bacteroidales bacterium]